MKPLHRVLATLLPIAVLVAVPATGSAARRSFPDLVVKKITIKRLPGQPPYVVEDAAGHTRAFVVDVITKNIGRAESKLSRTKLEFTTVGGRQVRGMTERVPKLKPGASHTIVFEVDLSETRHPPLGLLKVFGSADSVGTVQEVNEQNNTRHASLLPVIAEQWKVLDFMITQDLSGASFPGALESEFTKTCWQADCGRFFVFRFSAFDEAAKVFKYVPEGTIRAGWQYLYPPLQCTGNANEIRGPKTWPGQLLIESTLDWYDAAIEVHAAEAPPARGSINCPGSPVGIQQEWAFQDLQTFVGERQHVDMPSPYETKLTGHTEKQTIAKNKSTWQWTFQADVPGA
jgi:hypothetical protein